ncbi:MAG: TonB-dependent receptor [Rhodocyclaceae bacterium]|nr:MAG: TonB-dependent receptor [Rhodocyclaceae bacterium]
MHKTTLALAIATLPLAAHAAGSETVMPTVVVTDRPLAEAPLPGSYATSDSASLLESNPGFSVYSAGGVSGLPVLRGLADDRIKVRIDGTEITSACGNHMNSPLSYIAPSQVNTALVIAGITPVSLGGDNIAGVINLTSAQPVFAKPNEGLITTGSASIQSRSVDNGLSTSLNATVANDQLSFNYSGSVAKADSYKDGDGKKVLDTLYKSTNQALTLAAQGEGNRWVLKAGEQVIPYQGFPNQYMDMTKNHSVFANLGYSGDFAWGKLDGKVYWQDTRHKMDFFTQEKAGAMPMDTHGRDIGYTLKVELPLKDGDTLRLGHEIHRAELDDWWPPLAGSMMMGPNTYVNINNGKRERFALFAEWEAKFSSQWSSQLGVRSESVKTDAGNVQDYGCGMMCGADAAAASAFNARSHAKRDNNLDLTALFKYEPAQTASYEFGYARKTRSPNLYERYTWGRGEMAMAMIGWFGDGNGYVGNVDLKPEVAHTLSATLDWHDIEKKFWNVKVTPFYTRVTDFIDVDDLGPGMMVPKLLQFANHDAHLYGLNLSWSLPVWESAAYGNGVLKGKYDWTRGKRNDGGDLYHIMPANFVFGIEQKLNAWTNSAEMQSVAAKTSVDERRLEFKTSGYTLVNLGTRYDLSNGLSIQAGVRNLFDRSYALPLGGNNIAVTYAGGPLGPLLGQGRSIDLGLTLKF